MNNEIVQTTGSNSAEFFNAAMDDLQSIIEDLSN